MQKVVQAQTWHSPQECPSCRPSTNAKDGEKGHDQDALGKGSQHKPVQPIHEEATVGLSKNTHSEIQVEKPKLLSRSNAQGASKVEDQRRLRLRCHYQNLLTSRCKIRRPVSPDTHAMYGLGLKMRRQPEM